MCTAGISRSATICIAYLMKNEGMGLEEAFALVKEARKFIKPNPGFMKFLEKYETRCINERKAAHRGRPKL